MKRAILILFLSFASLGETPASGAITVVATTAKGGISTGVTSDAIDTTGANLIVIAISRWTAVVTVSDNKSNTYTPLTLRQVTSNNANQLFYCASPTVGTGHTFTGAATGSFPSIAVVAASGAALVPFDQENGATATASSLATGSITPSENNCLVIAGVAANGTSFGINGGFTAAASDYAAGVHVGGGIAYLVQTTAAAANPTWTWTGGSSPVAATIASFKAAPTVKPSILYYYHALNLPAKWRHLARPFCETPFLIAP
jgi:hypothetical protein